MIYKRDEYRKYGTSCIFILSKLRFILPIHTYFAGSEPITLLCQYVKKNVVNMIYLSYKRLPSGYLYKYVTNAVVFIS
jgi:hypothetical protein